MTKTTRTDQPTVDYRKGETPTGKGVSTGGEGPAGKLMRAHSVPFAHPSLGAAPVSVRGHFKKHPAAK